MQFFNRSLVKDFADVIFPRECAACKILLNTNEEHLCTRCLYRMPKTYTWKEKDNYAARLFWGRIYLENVSSFLLFQKGTMVQEILHEFKYRKQKEIGFYLGKLFGNELKNTNFHEVDLIIPVPLHKKKEIERGYNQSEWIAKGISEKLNKPLKNNLIKRIIPNESQTRKHKYDRWLNVDQIFEIVEGDSIIGKHILLIDDVLTTGATIESCAQEILSYKDTKISVATLAMAV